MTEDRAALAAYRLDQAHHAVRQADLLFEADEWSGAINRAYYAMFYAALGLLATRGLGSSKHSGVIALVDKEFVRPGILTPALSRALREAFNERQKADYAEMMAPSSDRARFLVASAREFVAAIEVCVTPSDDPRP